VILRGIFNDLGLKLLALVLSIGLWMSVVGEPVVDRGLDVPLGFENIPSALQVAGDPPDSVRVRVRGAMSIVNGLQAGDVVAVLDLAGERPGDRRLFDMFAGRIRTPFGVEVTQVVPATITVALERMGAPRTVLVVPDIEGQPAEGFAVGRISTIPATVDVVGPGSLLDELAEALTEPVSVDGASERVQSLVTVGVADPVLRLQTPISAEVTVEIVSAPVERTLHELPVGVRDVANGQSASVEPEVITVGVRASTETIRVLDAGTVEAFIDLAGLTPGRYNLPVTVESNAEIGVTHIDPPSVLVTLR